MRPTLSLVRPLAFALALALFAAPASAYTIFLKDGSKILAKQKYEVAGDKAYLILPSGTRSVIDLAEIDVARTEAENQAELGTAMVLEGGQLKQMGKPAEPPKRKTLADLIGERGDEPARRDDGPAMRPPSAIVSAATVSERTPAGNPDFRALQRKPLRDLDLGGSLKEIFTSQGVAEVGLFQGTAANRVFLDVTARSESAVFRAVAVSCAALVNLRGRSPGKLDAIELLVATPERELGGQFVITPEMAQELLNKQVDIHTFFVAHVRF